MSEHERITINLSPNSQEALNFLTAQGGGSTKTDSINKALQFYAEVKKMTNDGGAVYIREPNSKEVERIRIF